MASPGVEEADARRGGVKFVAALSTPEAAKKMAEIAPGTYPSIRKAGSATGIVKDMPLMTTDTYLIATKDMSDEAELLTMEIGHGIGMYHYGFPIINRQWSLEHPQVFEAGMTIAIEGREGEPGQAGVRIEDAVVVTENGAELIDHWPRNEILVAPRS